MGRQIRRVPRLPQPHGAERRAAHDALRPLRVHVPGRVGGVVHRGGVSGGDAVPHIPSRSIVEGAAPRRPETPRTGMIQSRLLRRLGLLAALAAGYFVAGKLGLEVAYVHPSATAVWPPTGLTLAALLLAGYDVWPAILLGAFLVNITTAGSVATSAAIAVGNTLQGLAVVGIAVFDGHVPWKDKHYPLEFLCVPLLLWAAFRFEQREAATVVVLLAGVAIWGTLRGYGPFARPLFNESLLLLQSFQGVSAVITLVLAAAVAERTEAVDRLRRLAVSDPLTRLSHYRQLAHALDAEIPRASRRSP